MLIQNTELEGKNVVDLRFRQGLVSAISDSLSPEPGERLIDARGGALLPGLHDHHIHLHAFAAARSSVICGPPQVTDIGQLGEALNAETGSDWVRGISYHDSVAGEIDRWQLDELISNRPVRIQHRSGKMWIVNSVAAEILELEDNRHLAGIECDENGRPNGRLFRLDGWLRSKTGSQGPPNVEFVSKQLASYGVTGITDATPSNSAEDVDVFVKAIENKQLLQDVLIMGDLELSTPVHRFVKCGAYKILLDEHRLPDIEDLIQGIAVAHERQRPVAIHCVTRTELIFALSAIIAAGHFPGDRVEHASVTPDEALPLMQRAQVAVVTQFGFIKERGDQYLRDVKPQDHELLYRGKAFLDAGVSLAGSSDAPYGSPDPWLAMRAAVERTSSNGKCIGAAEKLTPEQALVLFTTSPELPGSSTRMVALGEAADFCLLDRCWASARARLDCRDVLATVKDGELIYCR